MKTTKTFDEMTWSERFAAAMPSALSPTLRSYLVAHRMASPDVSDETAAYAVRNAILAGTLTIEEVNKMNGVENQTTKAGPSRSEVLGGGSVRIKDTSEKFSDHRYPAKHAKTGRPVFDQHGQEVSLPSELSLAKSGVFLKKMAQRAGIQLAIEEHEQNLWEEMLEKGVWAGQVNGNWFDEVPGTVTKTILDDTTSGGLEVAPIEFDRDIVTFPLLNGELFPFIDVKDVPRGRRIEGGSIGNPTVTWGVNEGTALTEFTTDNLIAAIDTSIFPVTVALTAGRDWLSDAAVDVGRILVELIGQRLMQQLDYVVANGNGTTQPEGIFTAAGITDVGAPVAGAGGAWATADVEELIFATGKQYRNAAFGPCFIANDTTYSRIRGMATATSAGWVFNSRALGFDEQSYRALEYSVRIQNDITNARCAFGGLKKYRMYRRLGEQVEWSTEGRTLRLANEALLTVRARFGGKVVDTSAFVKGTQYQA